MADGDLGQVGFLSIEDPPPDAAPPIALEKVCFMAGLLSLTACWEKLLDESLCLTYYLITWDWRNWLPCLLLGVVTRLLFDVEFLFWYCPGSVYCCLDPAKIIGLYWRVAILFPLFSTIEAAKPTSLLCATPRLLRRNLFAPVVLCWCDWFLFRR